MHENPLKGAKVAAVKIHKGSEVILDAHVGDTQEWADASAKEAGEKAIRAGYMVTWADGTREWIAVVALFENGSEVFHDDGNRIRCVRKRVTLKDGVRTEKELGQVWRRYDLYYADE